jgi:hypothetical protein
MSREQLQLTRRHALLGCSIGVPVVLGGCIGTRDDDNVEYETGGNDTADENGDGSVDLDAYDVELDVPDERHEEALENFLEGIELVNDSEEGDELYIDGEIVSYTDDGDEAEVVVEYPMGYTEPDDEGDLGDTPYAAGEFIGEQIVISVLLGSYAAHADSHPEAFEVRYIENGIDDPFETSTMTAEEAAGFYEENETDDGNQVDGEGENDGLPDEADAEQREADEDYLEFGDLVIQEHEMRVEEDEFLEEVWVEGIVENTDDERYDYVEVGIRVYDADGNQLDRYLDNTTDLDGGQTWAFEVPLLEEADDIDDYDIAVTGSQY